MEQIAAQLIEMNRRDWLDIVGILVPVILSAVLIFQNQIISKRNELLQKQIHNRDIINQAHEDILRIYRTYYDLCDVVFTSGLSESVRHADVAAARTHLNDIYNMKRQILQNLDLARLLFSQQPKVFSTIEDCFNSDIHLLDLYHDYIFSGRLNEVSENAWNTIVASSNNSLHKSLTKYNYNALGMNPQMYQNFVAICKTSELEEINRQIEVVLERHNYDNFGKFFEQYLCLKEV